MAEKSLKNMLTHTGERPLVAVSLRQDSFRYIPRLLHAIRSEASERGWDLLNLSFTDWALPEDLDVSGVLIDNLPDSDLAQRLREDIGNSAQ